MRIVTIILAVLLLLLQYPLWLGKGGWLKVWELNREVEAQHEVNRQTEARNALLDAEVRDLKQGTEAVEERARSELGMIRNDEIFFRILDANANQTTEDLAASSAVAAAPANR